MNTWIDFILKALFSFFEPMLRNGVVLAIESLAKTMIDFGSLINTFSSNNVEIALYDIVLSILTIMKSAGASILVIMLLMEFVSMTSRIDNVQGMTGVELPMKTMIKGAIIYSMFISIVPILDMVKKETDKLILGIGSTPVNFSVSDVSAAAQTLTADMSFFSLIGTFLLIGIVLIIFNISTLVVNVVFITRLFELYILLAIAPIPFSFMASQSQSSIAINYLKSFGACCLQGVMLVIVIKFFAAVVGSITFSAHSSINAFLMQVVLCSVVLMVAISSTYRWAKSALHAM